LLLSVRDIKAGYGRAVVLHGVSLDVEEGEIVSLLGPNGAGKTTTLRAISGLLPLQGGTVHFAGKQWRSETPEARARARLGHVPEGRGILRSLTVEENLTLVRSLRGDGATAFAKDLDNIYDILPALRERPKIKASALSGGQQQMLAIGRALLGRPRLLIIDELSFGLAPIIVNELFALIRELREQGTTFLLVEQNAGVLLLSDRTYVLARGRITLEAKSSEIVGSERLVRSYMGSDAASKAVEETN
jgi:branched-chain amino acid transport system ATP-binding protein